MTKMGGTNPKKVYLRLEGKWSRPPLGRKIGFSSFTGLKSGRLEGLLTRRRPAEDAAQIIREGGLFRESLALGLLLTLHHPELRKHAVPLGFQPADFLIRQFADAAN